MDEIPEIKEEEEAEETLREKIEKSLKFWENVALYPSEHIEEQYRDYKDREWRKGVILNQANDRIKWLKEALKDDKHED